MNSENDELIIHRYHSKNPRACAFCNEKVNTGYYLGRGLACDKCAGKIWDAVGKKKIPGLTR